MPIYKVQAVKADSQNNPKPRLVKADRLAQVESYLLQDFSIERASAEDTHALGKDGVEVEAVA